MGKKRSSLTITVFAGYFLLAALAGFAVWFVYNQVVSYTQMTEKNNTENEALLLVGEAATELYQAESLSRQLIQSGNLQGLEQYNDKLDTINSILAQLLTGDEGDPLKKEIDSINFLLSHKADNLEELLELRASGETESYYSRVLEELRKVDETFDEPNYDQRFRDLAPHQRRVLIKLLEYSRLENPEPSNITVDSLITAVKAVLNDLEKEERRYRIALRNKEDALLSNEIKINSKLRGLLSTIETEERERSLRQVSNWQKTVEETSRTIAFLGAVSLLIILIFVFLVIRDVSRSQRYRNQLERSKSYAESLLISREQFMNTVTHDLRSPLNAVVGYTGLLEKTSLEKSQTRYLNQIKKSSNYLLHLVNDLLDLSKLEAGRMSVEKLTFNPRNLIEETVENAIPPDKPDEVSISVDIHKDLDKPIISDPFRIKQILTNLVNNACKFTREGSIEVRAWLGKKEVLHIEVRDTGIGISKDQKEKVFEEFSQEDDTIEKKYGGSGLGLAISKKLTHLLQGRIELESETGKGSTFLVRIPVDIPVNPPSEPQVGAPELKDLENYTVLIVDDEPAQLGLLKEFIRSTGMSYTTAGNGREALNKLKKEKIDLVLTDIQMPDMDGLDLLAEIRSQNDIPHLPVIALSGQANVTPEEYRKRGFQGSLLKPYSSEELLSIIEDVLRVEFQKNQKGRMIPVDPLQGYSLSEIKSFAGEEQEALNAILIAFLESTEHNIRFLRQAYRDEAYEKISSVAHKMLPMFRQLRADQLASQLEILEKGEIEEIQKINMEELNRSIYHLLDKLRKEIII